MTPKEKILARSMDYRGRIINATANFERWIDIYLATYFCSDWRKRNQMVEMVFANNRMSFDSKRKLFENILRKQNIKMSDLSPELNKDLNTMFTERNTFAHNSVFLQDEAKLRCDTEVGFVKYGVNTRIDWYDDKRIADILSVIERCISAIEKLHTGK